MVDDRSSLLDRAETVATQRGCGPGDRTLLAGYYADVADDDLLHRDPTDVCGQVLAHRGLAERRTPGTHLVRVFTPSVEVDGWASPHTVVHVVTDDMPFLVDSVTNEMSRHGRGIHLVVHPQVVVRRDDDGVLQEVLAVTHGETDPDDERPGVVVESWISVEVDRSAPGEAGRSGTGASGDDEADGTGSDDDALAEGIGAVLDDVRAAVEDWPEMRRRASSLADEVAVLADSLPAGTVDPDDTAEAARLLHWLADEHFTFLGYREYALRPGASDDTAVLESVPGTGLGIMRSGDEQPSRNELGPSVTAQARRPDVLVLTKANSRATVHRATYLDYVGVKTYDDDGRVVGERRFLGLLSSAAYTQSVSSVPVVDRKVATVLERSGFGPRSHSGKDLLTILETYPRDELFASDVPTLQRIALGVLQLQERRRTRLFVRHDPFGRYVSCLVYLPRDRYTTEVRLVMQDILVEAFGGTHIEHSARVSESVLARLHFVVRLASRQAPDGSSGDEAREVDLDAVEQRLVAATRTWEEDLADGLRTELGEGEAVRMARRWSGTLPEGYKEDVQARVAVGDLVRLERLEAGRAAAPDLDLLLYTPVGAASRHSRLKIYRREQLGLSEVLPFFDHLGVEVVDQRPYHLRGDDQDGEDDARAGTPRVDHWVYDFGLRLPSGAVEPGTTTDPARLARRFTDAFVSAWCGTSESDRFDRLVLRAGLTWRQVVVLRTYARYLRQTGTTFSEDYIAGVLAANPEVARLLVAVFETRFEPDRFSQTDAGRPSPARLGAADRAAMAVEQALDDVDNLTHDRILRSLLATVVATDRTNFYQRDGAGEPNPTVAVKLDPRLVPDLPDPRPAHEIWVCGPKVEGVHLRFGDVARGGLRWSDRLEDFRTEVLGLVKAQQVKNVVIVPTGAKGGFVGKHLPDPAKDREAWYEAGKECYRTFIRALLDVTDDRDLAAGEDPAPVVPPVRVVRHDDDDPYLVVAADKGTAAFSDVANAISLERGFWLGDAFASGGSKGYDHKAMGITARGAWESVRWHFDELGVDVDTDPFTVVGVGDMSGDVFGNGMLLSKAIRLVVAFDHRHVFIDPDPDPGRSWEERARLFALPRSSWADYDTSLLSEGGGVHPRSAKSVRLPARAAAVLGLPERDTVMTPTEIIRAALTAPVDLLWNGGIGTYVKASDESNAAVGDKANDALRVDGADLRCRVVGEGGNLGLTQRGRIEAALAGVRLNTDAIDNSAGVDTSDHEVNIKILLDRVVAEGDLTDKQRDRLLADMTDDIGARVLRHNVDANVQLGNARLQAAEMLPVHRRFIGNLVANGLLDRALEFLPDDDTLDERAERDLGLASPELAVVSAYAKLTLTDQLLDSAVPDEAWSEGYLVRYFPERLREAYERQVLTHPLRREIIATSLANTVLNTSGTTFLFRLGEELNAAPDRAVRAWAVAREVFGQADWHEEVMRRCADLPVPTRLALLLDFRRLLDRATRWLLQNRPDPLDVDAEIARFGPVVSRLRARSLEVVQGQEREEMLVRVDERREAGVPEDLATRAAGFLEEFCLLDVTEIALREDAPAEEVLEVYFALSDRYAVDGVLSRITQLPRGDRWQALARAALRYDLYAALEELTTVVVRTTSAPAAGDGGAGDGGDRGADGVAAAAERISAWESANTAALDRARLTLDEVQRLPGRDLAPLSVALRTLRSVVKSGTADDAR
ncbi:NAD-glutamate dehydrogenase [Aquipuribacter nitratireducens]|uniref:NAD-glutamate dehydrogenase n=1 Tax=Aquipuribacter nitratireducens TaxID=650104 RepID=A0ABW0GSG3_9MICO